MILPLLILSAAVTANAHLRVCYYSNWSQYRQGSAKFLPEDIDPFLCTHLVYSFANLVNNQLARFEDNDVDLYGRFNNLKTKNPNLKTLLAVGGWTAGSAPFSTLAASSTLRKNFAITSAAYLRTYGFDGLDMDWEYPALRGGAAADKANFILLLKDLKEEFAREKDVSGLPQLLLTAAVAAGKGNIDTAYDIPGMNRYLDFINLMAYDLHGGWESSTGHNAPLYSRSSEQGGQAYLNVDWAARYWVEKGTPANKLIIGLATYGRTFTLANANNNGMGAPAVGSGGNAGPFTATQGFLAYYEVCLKLSRNEGTRMWDDEHEVPYLVDGNQWIGYDDEESITLKLEYIRDNDFGGAMVWNIDLDDFQQICPLSTKNYALMSLMREVLDDNQPPTNAPTDQPTDNPPTNGSTDAPTDTPTNAPTDAPTNAPTNGPTNPPTNGPTDSAHLRVCYYSNWSQYRQGSAKFLPEDIDPFLCTHLIYSFANLVNNQLARFEDNDVDLYGRFNNLKTQNPNLKTLLAVGGWTAGSAPFSTLAASSTLRKNFATNSAAYLRTYNFDGLDMDWEYPALRGGAAADKANFILLLKDLKEEFEREKDVSGLPQLLLTAAVAAGKGNIDTAYDIPGMNRYLDFINLMAYDLHGGWESSTGHNAPLYSRSAEQSWQAYLNVDWAARYWVEKGTPANKLIIGLATYGRTFTLANPNNNGMGAPAVGSGGNAGPFTATQGFLAYYEVCLKLSRNEGIRMWDDEHEVPYLVDGNQWIGYDDEESITRKLEYIRDIGFGGAMVWNIDLDDFQQICPLSTRNYALMSLMKEVLDGTQPPTNGPTDQPTGNPPTNGPTDAPTNMPTNGPTEAPTNGPTNPPTNGPTDTEFCSNRADGLYPDVLNCNKYYHCYASNTYHKSCPPNLVFNPKYSYCDFTYNYNCVEITTPNPGTTTEEPTQPPTTQPPTTEAPTTQPPTTQPPVTQQPTTQPPTTKPPTTQPPTTQPPTTQPPTTQPPTTQPPTTQPPTTQPPSTQPPTTQPPTTQPPTQPPTTQPPTTQPPTTQPPTTQPPTTQPPTTQSPTTQEPWQPDPDFCADRSNGLYKVDEDCSKYYHCSHGITYVYTCLSGTLYSASMKNCDWAANVDCSDMGPTTEFCHGQPDGLYWYPDDCKKYYECGSGITYIKSCAPGTLYDSSVKNCGWRGTVDCKGAPDN